MKYPNIASTLSWTEVPDLQEGLHLQPVEAAAIDTALATSAADLQTANETNNTQAARITELEGLVATANTERDAATATATKATEDLATANTRITELENLPPVATTTTEADRFQETKVNAMDFDFQKDLLSQV